MFKNWDLVILVTQSEAEKSNPTVNNENAPTIGQSEKS